MSDKWEKKRDKKHRPRKEPKEENADVQQGTNRYVDDISNFLYNFKNRDEDDEELPPVGWDKAERKPIEKRSPQATKPLAHDRRDRVVKALPMSDAHRQAPSKRANPMPLEPPSSHHLEPLNK